VLTQTKDKYQEVLEVAEGRYRQSADWVTFFREVLGVEGTVRKAFPTFDELAAFEKSEQYEKIQKLLVKLREKRPSADADSEPTRVITVRLPKSMHESLRTEAHDLRTSMNKLCISKLLQVIGEEMIPNERSGGGESPRPAAPPKPVASTPTVGQGLGVRNHQPTSPSSVPYTQSVQSTPPPFKSAQSRF
jgi:predicted HicB family RNase H-like nuclease